MFKILSFNGRINRGEYAITFVGYVAFYIFFKVMVSQDTKYGLLGFAFIPIVYILWAQGAKRCHDINKSGWWQLVPFYFIALLSTKGDDGPNQYDVGTEPYYGADDYVKPYDADIFKTPGIAPTKSTDVE